MAKQAQEPTKEQQERAKIIQERKNQSTQRMTILAKNVFDAVKATCEQIEKNGGEQFTFTEMNEVFIRVQHSYNGKALANQFTK